jgi:hypothetical protein
MSVGISRRRSLQTPVLVCLDPRQPVAGQDSDDQDDEGHAPWRRSARRLLQHARACNWPIGHLLLSHPAAEALRWRAIPGLSPQPMEAVFYHEVANPCGNSAFRRFTEHYGRAEVILMGNSIAASALTAALSLSVNGCALAVARDAIATSAHEWRGLKALAGLAPNAPTAGVRIEPVSRLITTAPELRLIIGGRA